MPVCPCQPSSALLGARCGRKSELLRRGDSEWERGLRRRGQGRGWEGLHRGLPPLLTLSDAVPSGSDRGCLCPAGRQGITSILAPVHFGMWWRKWRLFCLYLVWSGVGGFLSQAWEDCEPKESRKPVREAPSSSGLHMEACYQEGLLRRRCGVLPCEAWEALRAPVSMPPAASPSCCWPTSRLEVLPSAQRPPPPPLPTTASKQDHGVVAGVTSDAPQVSSPGPAGSCPVRKAYFGGLASSLAGPSVPTLPPHPVWPPDRVLSSRGWTESSGCGSQSAFYPQASETEN